MLIAGGMGSGYATAWRADGGSGEGGFSGRVAVEPKNFLSGPATKTQCFAGDRAIRAAGFGQFWQVFVGSGRSELFGFVRFRSMSFGHGLPPLRRERCSGVSGFRRPDGG